MTPDRLAARIEGDFVVFLIGMRINALHRPDKWVPVARAMGRAMVELRANPDLGLLGSRTLRAGRHIDVVQYWRSFEHLHAYARARDAAHLPAWRAYNRAVRGNDAVGVWHETFLVRAGDYEAVYRSMPPYGLAAASGHAEAVGNLHSAAGRLGRGVEPDLI
ncbi:MAG: DUF4188 domain-containing protein [Bacteroidota bacterium]